MLQGILMVVVCVASYFLVYLAYGKAGMQMRKERGMKFSNVFQSIIVGFVLIVYCLLIGLWNMAKSHEWVEYALLVGVPVLYGVYVLLARLWSKRMVKLWEEEKEQLRKEQWQKKEQERQRKAQEEAEAAQKQEQIQQARATMDDSAFRAFLASAAYAQRFTQLLECWDGLNPTSNALNDMVRKDIVKQCSVERMYGSTPEKVTGFVKKLEQTYSNTEA